ncbi:hypothetical protein [Bacillus sp. JCM 19041]
MPRVMIRRPSQLIRSAYMLFFQLPVIPEKLMASGRFHYMAKGWQ